MLCTALVLAPGCDTGEDGDFGDDADEGAIASRCPGCGVGGLGNTSKIGDHAVSNLSRTMNVAAANTTASVKITGATASLSGITVPIIQIAVDADGELRLQLSTGGWIAGPAVRYASFDIKVTPNSAFKLPVSGKLMISDVRCEPGLYAPAMTICRYEFVTDIPTSDPNYPPHEKFPGYTHVCPNEDEKGELSGLEKFHSVLSPQVALTSPTGATPRIDLLAGQFINGCLNGAVSKGQYYLNAFYDNTAFRGLAASQRSAMLLMWMAWHDGATRTQPGQMISPHDPIGGLFTWTGDADWDLEGGYMNSGASCRGGSLTEGLHRLIPAPVLNLAGWSALPHCDASDIAAHATLGVKVEVPL